MEDPGCTSDRRSHAALEGAAEGAMEGVYRETEEGAMEAVYRDPLEGFVEGVKVAAEDAYRDPETEPEREIAPGRGAKS